MKSRIVWKRHLSQYRSDKGYTIQSPQRGSYYSLLLPDGSIGGRYPKLFLAKEAAEKREQQRQRDALGVARNGHEVFESMWGAFDVTVATKLAEEHGEQGTIGVESFSKLLRKTSADGLSFTVGIGINDEHVPTVDLTKPVILVQLMTRDGAVTPMVIDGWHRIAKAQRQGVAELPCLVLSEEDSELVKL